MEAAEILAEEGISVEVIDVRCLVPLDMETLARSSRKTNRVLIVEEDNMTGGWGAEIGTRLGEEVFYYLDAPIKRAAAPDTPVPAALTLESAYVPDVEKIVEGVRLLIEGG